MKFCFIFVVAASDDRVGSSLNGLPTEPQAEELNPSTSTSAEGNYVDVAARRNYYKRQRRRRAKMAFLQMDLNHHCCWRTLSEQQRELIIQLTSNVNVVN